MTGKHAMYVIGEPGIGKTTLVQELTAGVDYETTENPFAMRVYDGPVTYLGKRRGTFSGTDALSMDVIGKVEQYLEGVAPPYIIAEGDRLANSRFFDFLARNGYELPLYLLQADGLAERRRLLRGSVQDEKWLKGRATKVRKLAHDFGAIRLDATPTPATIAKMIHNPVVLTLRLNRTLGAMAVGVEA
jgi:hypothetical protein